ncbi:hypothetical protein DRI50_00145 [candidate division KSB1 bacterium]|nr:MAG: hypothetical protein DRI50_00145 [candidate division KSB1 bacterium]
MRFLFLFIFVLFNFSRADVWSDVRQYIQARSQQTPQKIEAKCGFGPALELRLAYPNLPAQLQKAAAPLLQKPKRQYAVVSPSGHFTLHYDLTGYNKVPAKDSLKNGIPDYIDSAAVILEHVWDVEINQMGFRPPPDSTGQPVQSYPVYFSSMGYYGVTNFDLKEDLSSLPGQNYASYLELHNNFAGSGFATNGLAALKVTAAHEFHHAIQLGYQLRWNNENGYPELPDRFFMEMTSTFMEDYVYDQVNDYVQYVNRFLPVADTKPFNITDNNTEYANCIYLHMLAKVHGVEIIRKIWEHIVRYPALPALDLTLRNYDDSFDKSFNQYAAWLYFSGHHADSLHYFKDGALFADLKVSREPQDLNKDLNYLSMRHVRILVDETSVYRAKVSCPSASGRLSHVLNEQKIQPSVKFNGVQYFAQMKRYPLIAVLTNSTMNTLEGIDYSLSKAPAMVKKNPVIIVRQPEQVQFINVPMQTRITIYNILGQKLKTIRVGETTTAFWNLKDNQNRSVASGMYLYRISGNGFSTAGKFVMVK